MAENPKKLRFLRLELISKLLVNALLQRGEMQLSSCVRKVFLVSLYILHLQSFLSDMMNMIAVYFLFAVVVLAVLIVFGNFVVFVPFLVFSCPGSSIPDLGQSLSDSPPL